MGKVGSGFGLHKCAKREQLLEDHISQLPHEILVHILSFLTFKEAARTSVLSKCWTNLWTYSARLDFYDFSALERIRDSLAEEYKSVRERERCKFVKWVNKVLQSHKTLSLDEFRVHFHLKRSSQEAIDEWLQFAFSRKVQRLELDLSGNDNLGCPSPKSYAFPYGPLGTSGKSAEINPCALIDFKSLKALSLNRVNMSGEVLEFILHNCQYLERLVVRGSENLINVEVSGPPALKHLEIFFCYNMKCLTICDANLVSLKISCVDKLVLKNVPMLIDVYVHLWSRNGVRGVIARLSCCLLTLEVLTFSISSDEARKLKEMVHELPQLPKLKQLTLKVLEEDDKSLLGLTSLIRVSPNLEKLVIKMDWDDEIVRRRRRKFGEAINYSLHHLKVFKVSGFLGCTIDVELVKYFLINAVALEKVIIDPRCDRGSFCCPEMEWETEEGIEEENAVRRRARQQLNRLIPAHVEFVIL